jgi:hypothetical protein
LIDYIDGRFPDSEVASEMAELLMMKLTPHAGELQQFRDLLT